MLTGWKSNPNQQRIVVGYQYQIHTLFGCMWWKIGREGLWCGKRMWEAASRRRLPLRLTVAVRRPPPTLFLHLQDLFDSPLSKTTVIVNVTLPHANTTEPNRGRGPVILQRHCMVSDFLIVRHRVSRWIVVLRLPAVNVTGPSAKPGSSRIIRVLFRREWRSGIKRLL